MNLRTLRAFVEVVRQGSFSQAAEMVSLTQSSVSKAVKTLEEELGTPLFSRIGHKSELTAAGEIAYRRALVLLAERSDLVAEINDLLGLKRGVLRIGLPPVGSGELFAAMFAEYRQRYPQIEIELIEHGSKKLGECLQAGEVDVAALLVPVEGEFEYQDVRVEPLMVVLPSSHPLSGRKSVDFSDLSDSPFILFEAGFGFRLSLQTVRQLRFAALIVQFAVAQLLFDGSKRGVELFHLFFEAGNLFTQRLRLGAQLRFTALLVFTRLGAVGVVFR